MKRMVTYLIIMFMFLIVTHVFAKPDITNPKRILKCYENSLQYSNEGVVKSAIKNIMKMKIAYPDADYTNIIKQLGELSFNSSSKNIRYNAYLAVNFLKYPEQLNWNMPERYEDLDKFFQQYDLIFNEPVAKRN